MADADLTVHKQFATFFEGQDWFEIFRSVGNSYAEVEGVLSQKPLPGSVVAYCPDQHYGDLVMDLGDSLSFQCGTLCCAVAATSFVQNGRRDMMNYSSARSAVPGLVGGNGGGGICRS